MTFYRVKRHGLIVWLYTLKQLKHIRKFGHVQFISKRLRYVVLYVNESDKDETIAKLNKLHFVQKVEESYRDQIDMTWKDAIPNRKDRDIEKASQTLPAYMLSQPASLSMASLIEGEE
ncbi:TPA: YlbG family protein [Streptococcus suis]